MLVELEQVKEYGLLRTMKGETWWREMTDAACTEVTESVKNWYMDKPDDWFDNPDPFPDGTSRRDGPRKWMAELTQGGRDAGTGWSASMTDGGFSVSFMNPDPERVSYGLRLHHFGGEITPKTRRALTIPLTADARGVRADKFPRELFVVKGDEAKKNPDSVGTLVWRDDAGELHAAYALRTRAEVKPLKERRGHEAIPTGEDLGRMCKAGFISAMKEAMRF